MAKFIKEFYDFMSFLEGKDIASKRPPEQVDAAIHFVTIDVFNHYLDHYAKTKKIVELLGNYMRRKDVPLASGIGSLPEDYAYTRVIYKDDQKTKIDLVPDDMWNNRATRVVGAVSEKRPIARIDYSKDATPVRILQVLPISLQTCELNYFKKPSKPKYAYTISGTKYVYDDANSIDLEFSLMLYPDVLSRVLSAISINLRENQLFQYMEIYKSQDQRK